MRKSAPPALDHIPRISKPAKTMKKLSATPELEKDPYLLAAIMEGYASFVLEDMTGLCNQQGWRRFAGKIYMQQHYLRSTTIRSQP